MMEERSIDSVVHIRGDNEALTKLLFLDLDPTLRMLLVLQRQLQARGEEGALEIPLLHKEHELLIQLEASIHSFQSNEALAKQSEVSASLCIMLKYISLPLIVANKVPCLLDWNLSTEISESSLLVRSVLFKCVGQAARVWNCLVRCIGADRLHKENDNLADLLLEAVVSLVRSLPSGQQVIDNQQNSLTVLDRGEACLQELMHAVVQLLPLCSSSSLDRVWEDGGIVVRLADTCIAMLSPVPTTSQDDRHLSSASNKPRSLPLSLRQSAAAALLALLRKDATSTSRPMWQHSFPGCFAGLYRALMHSLRLNHRTSHDSFTPTLLKCLTQLLQCTLLNRSNHLRDSDDAPDASSPSSMLQQLVHKANNAWSKEQYQGRRQLQDPSSEPVGAEEESFLEQVRQKLPGPLMVLIPLLHRVNSVDAMREVSSLLVALHRARHCWNDEQVANCIYECCLVLSSREGLDGQAKVECHQVMEFSERSAGTLGGKILDLILDLKALALKKDQEDLQTKFRLATSLLSRLDRKSVQRLRVALVSGHTALEVISCLIFVFDVDFSSTTIPSSRVVETTGAITESNLSKRFQPRYLEVHALECAHAFVREFGRILRPKTTAGVVDSVLARMYQACAARLESNISLVGPSQVQWLHEWIGAFPLIESLLLGAFESSSTRHLAILSDMFESILPVITSGVLFDLPCHLPSHRQPVATSTSAILADVSVSAFQGNAAFVCCQVDLVGVVARLLNRGMAPFLPSCLYPLLVRASRDNPVQDMAVCTLRSIAFNCGYESLPGLIADNMTCLAGTINASLRIPGGGSLATTDEFDNDGAVVAGTVAYAFQLLMTIDADEMVDHSKQLTSLRGVVLELVRRFDQSSTRLDSSMEQTAVFLRLFQCALLHLRKEFVTSTKHAMGEKCCPCEEPWLRLLEQFRDVPESPRDGFVRALGEAGKFDDAPLNTIRRDELAASTQFAAHIMSRCCYALSSQSLLIQTKSVDALISGFSYLGWIASNVPPAPEESNGPTTAILRQVHSTWTAISARFEAATLNVAADEAGSTSVALFRARTTTNLYLSNQGEHRLFLSRLFELVATMAECAGDFMAVRLRESIWPCLSRVLSMFLRRLSHQPVGSNAPQRSYTDSEHGLLMSALMFLERVYSQRSVGMALSKLIPQTGTMLLPFLGDANVDVAEACTKAVQAMLRIDCDALWRPLLELSGRQMSTCPLLESASRHRDDQATDLEARTAKRTDRVAVAAGNLLDFIDDLPEQALH